MAGQKFHGNPGLIREEEPKIAPCWGRSCGAAQVLPLEAEEPAGPSHSLWEVGACEFGLPAA